MQLEKLLASFSRAPLMTSPLPCHLHNMIRKVFFTCCDKRSTELLSRSMKMTVSRNNSLNQNPRGLMSVKAIKFSADTAKEKLEDIISPVFLTIPFLWRNIFFIIIIPSITATRVQHVHALRQNCSF